MDRRTFLCGLTLGTLTAPLAAATQPAGKVWRIGFLNSSTPEQDSFLWAPLGEALGERGWAEGKNLVFERRYTDGNYERLRDVADELVHLRADVLVPHGGPATMAAKAATTTIPIVMWGTTDPVGIGAVDSLARPGGNVTGLAEDQGSEMVGKRLQILKEVAPKVAKVAVLTRVPPSAAVPRIRAYEQAYADLARALGLQQRWWYLQGSADVDAAFASLIREGFGAVDVTYVPVTWAHRRQIRDLAVRRRLPSIYWHRRYVLDGGLIAYGEDEREVPRRLALYLDKVLRGAKPADLPVEQPTKFELVINLKTAKALGLTIPQSLLLRADQVIE